MASLPRELRRCSGCGRRFDTRVLVAGRRTWKRPHTVPNKKGETHRAWARPECKGHPEEPQP